MAEELLGTCKSIGDVMEADYEMADWILIELVEAIVYQCEVCGWWVERDDVDGDGTCTDCACDA